MFEQTGITKDSVRAKSSVVANFVTILHSWLEIQQILHAISDDSNKPGLPDVKGVEMNLDGARQRANEGLFATVQGDSPNKNQPDDLYYTKQTVGKRQKHKRKRSAGYLAPTTTSNKKAGVADP